MRIQVLLVGLSVVACSDGVGPVPDGAFASIGPGFQHTCAVLGNDIAYCWGRNVNYQLGTGAISTRDSVPRPVAGPSLFARVDGGQGHSCGLASTGVALCWGHNGDGQLGDGLTDPSPTPVPVSGGLTFASIGAAFAHTCASTRDGVAYCWGNGNAYGVAGGSLQPVEVPGGMEFSMITVGDFHVCGLTQLGAAYCWGTNMFGQLGNDTAGITDTPVPVMGSLVFQSISAGNVHTCGLTTAGEVYCWGLNGTGQLGDSSTTDRASPVRLSGGRSYKLLTVGSSHGCALTTANVTFCWGNHAAAQLGAAGVSETCGGFGACSTVPVPVSGNHSFKVLRAGGAHSCGLDSANKLFCWGSNSDGQIGNGAVGGTVIQPVEIARP